MKTGKLSVKQIAATKKVGYLLDGGGLCFQYRGPAARSWVFRYTSPTHRRPTDPTLGWVRDFGLGPYPDITLAAAREEATKCRALVREGVDPIDHRRGQREQRSTSAGAAAKMPTFETIARECAAIKKAEFKNEKHAAQWIATLESYAFPIFGGKPVGAITSDDVFAVLNPIWLSKHETATRVRQRIEAVFGLAIASGFYAGLNPARLKDNIAHRLPKLKKSRVKKNMASLPYTQMGAFMKDLRVVPGVAARALEFTILTAARTNETIGARWTDIDIESRIWTIPADKMKMEREHRVALSARAVEILEEMRLGKQNDFVFPGWSAKKNAGLSDAGMASVLKRMRDGGAVLNDRDGRPAVVHGFRSTFSSWASATTNHPSDVVEISLAHGDDDRVRATYQRDDLLAKRFALMEDWASYCDTNAAPASVTPIRSTAKAAA